MAPWLCMESFNVIYDIYSSFYLQLKRNNNIKVKPRIFWFTKAVSVKFLRNFVSYFLNLLHLIFDIEQVSTENSAFALLKNDVTIS